MSRLVRNVGTIAGNTLMSRVLGFAREMIFSRVLGANGVTDAWFQAFIIPNVFRRLFAEGAFSAAFVPMFSKKLHGDEGMEGARSFSNDVLSVLLPVLIVLVILFELAMPGVIWLLADKPVEPGQFAIDVAFARIMFPYILLISLVTLLMGMLNSVSRFGPGASFPIILNLVLIAALLACSYWMSTGASITEAAYVLAWAVPFAGLLQFLWMYYWARREGFRPRLHRPRLTPEVKRLAVIALPAAIGGGAYQVNTLLQLFFLNQLGGGAVSIMNYADRLNQLPLGIIGIALSTAILPSLSKHIGGEDSKSAARLQSSAIELGTLLTLPAAVALYICAVPFVTVVFQGGRFDAADAAATGGLLGALVIGLPAYVLVKVLVPNFYARSDTKTPVYAALLALTFFIIFNMAFLERFGIMGVGLSSSIGAWLNVTMLYVVLARRGYYHLPAALIGRIARQILAAAAMGAVLYFISSYLEGWFAGSVFERAGAVFALVSAGGLVYFGVAFAVGAVDRQRISLLLKRKAS